MQANVLGNSPRLGPVCLRISVTDLCQYRCLYCIPPQGVNLFPRSRVLRYEQIVKFLCLIRKHLGLTKVRITGGEPLVRSNIIEFVRMLAQKGVQDLAMTTNGRLLAEFAPKLRQAGLQRITVSLDSLNPETYRQITRGGDVHNILEGIKAAAAAELTPIKLNATLLRGINDSEVPALASFAIEQGLTLRFIELMPIGHAAKEFDRWFVSSQEVLEKLGKEFQLSPLPRRNGSSSREFSVRTTTGRTGTIGVISSSSQPFCDDCNRLRLTATGELIGCLAKGTSQGILPLLQARGPLDEAQILRHVHAVMAQKRTGPGFSSNRNMVKVGG